MRKETTTLDILMYLFHHHMEQDQPINFDDMELVDELKSAGFHAHSIGKAFRWLHQLTQLSMEDISPSDDSFRIFSAEEQASIDDECRRFIISLEQQKILSPHTREIVIHQAMELIQEGLNLSLIKWITLMVLFNTPNNKNALKHMEFLVLHDSFENIH